ncbi:putative protein -like protein [Capsicum annuum]|nr:putative protein -like protein [Capsicum annuum]
MMDPEISADESYVSVPRGGPIYVSDMVGPLTKVADFEVSIFRELEYFEDLNFVMQRLKAELSSDSLEMFDDEISIEDLKTICEEDLVAQAFEEAFKDEELKKDSSQTLAEHLGTSFACVPHSFAYLYFFIPFLTKRRTDNGKSDAKLASLERSEREVDSYSKGSNKRKSNKRKRSKHVPAGSVSKKGSNKRKSNKKKWRKENDVDEHYMPKVEQLAKIQEKQEEEKAAARLHSFNGRCSSSQSAPISSSRGGRMISLKSVSLGTKVMLLRPFILVYCISWFRLSLEFKRFEQGFSLRVLSAVKRNNGSFSLLPVFEGEVSDHLRDINKQFSTPQYNLIANFITSEWHDKIM